MTGLVVVSHSRALADSAVALAMEMVAGSGVRIEVAAGLDNGELGTDAAAIVGALEAADDGSGVVVLMDLGSAVLSAEMALEMVDPDLADRVLLSPGPFVEGLVVAAVAAAGGAAPQRVAAEARRALAAKDQQLGASPAADDRPRSAGSAAEGRPAAPADTAGGEADTASGEFTLANPHGLHARPAARMVAEAQRLTAAGSLTLLLRNLSTGTGPVEADSMLELMTLGAERGHRVEVTAHGPGSRAAVSVVLELAGRGFDEEPAERT